MMKPLILTLLVALVAAHASGQVITTLKSYRHDDKPVLPPDSVVQSKDGTLYGMSHYTLFRLQPDGSGFSILKQLSLSGGQNFFVGRPAVSGNTLYGTRSSGMGLNGSLVTVFKINTDGTGYSDLKTNILFPTTVTEPGVVLSGETLYGWGFKINTDGTGYTELAGFPTSGGLQSWHLEIQISGEQIFGATVGDGQHGAGTVFRLNTDGTGYTVLRSFLPEEASTYNAYLTLVGDTLYGKHFVTTTKLFKLNTNGTGYSVFMEFPYGSPGELQYLYGGHLRHSGGKFYAAGGIGGTNAGTPTVTVFSMGMDGTGSTVLKRFIRGNDPNPASQGYFHVNLLTVEGDTIYGMAQSPTGFEGEASLDGRGGALFKMKTDGSGFAVLLEFIEPNLFPDGSNPGPLTVAHTALYGSDYAPGRSRRLFKMSTDGTGFTVLKGYDPNDRFDPIVRPTVSGSTLFGVAGSRGILQQQPYNASLGLVYRMNTDGTGYAVLKEFTTLADGTEVPAAALALAGSALYGTIGGGNGGPHGGKIFTLNTNGTAYAFLRTLGPSTVDTYSARWTNSEGVLGGNSELTMSDDTLYGTASEGGLFGCGTVFKMNTDGTGFTVLKHLTPQEGSYAGPLLTLSGNTLYGASSGSWEGVGGTVWRVNTDGTGFMVVKQFPDAVWDNASGAYTNSEGVNPVLGLALWGDTLYGTTSRGGRFGAGTLFKVNTDGSGFTVREHIRDRFVNPGFEGCGLRGLVVSGNTVYGSAPSGGEGGAGGIYRISLTPTLSIGRTGTDSLAVTWPSVWTDYILQQNTNATSSVSWGNVSDSIQDDGTNKTLIINPTDGSRFYRLVSP